MSGSEDDDWFNQDEDELVQGLEHKVKQQELKENEEHIEYHAPEGGMSCAFNFALIGANALCPFSVGDYLQQLNLEASATDGGSKVAADRFALTDFTKGLKMSPIDMFLYFFSEDRDLFVNQLAANDSLKRVSLFVEVLKSLCQLELCGFDDVLLSCFARQSVLLEKVKRLLLTLLAKASGGKCDAESEQMLLGNMKWLLLRAHRQGVLGHGGYELVELYKQLAPLSKSEAFGGLEPFDGTQSAKGVKGEIYPTLDQCLGKEVTKENPPVSNNVEEYVRKQRQLLRQDFQAPLLEFVQRLRSGDDIKALECQGLLWPGTTLVLNPEFAESQRHSLVFMKLESPEDNKKILINYIKNIKSGALLCLTTSLDFGDLILVSVGYTDTHRLQKGCLSVEIVRQHNIGKIYDRPLIMFQTPVFFEPYLRVHNYLSTCSTEQFAMRRYIVEGETEIQPPAYIKPGTKLSFNAKPFTLKSLPKDLPFNDRQQTAFTDALQREFCIIQGPPGTGKTHLSVELVNCLIQNAKALGTGPIIVLTYTNDSLDKFLVKISRYTKEVLRFGSQSRDPQIAKFNVRSMVNPELVPPRLKRIWWVVNCEYKDKFQRLQDLYTNFDGSEESYQETLVAQHELQQVAERIETLRTVFQYYLARNKDLLVMTTTCAARLNFLFRLLQAKCVVFEEAAEIQEAHILACLTPHTEHVILVGDHKQLQPFSGSNQVPQVSLFERLIVGGLPFTLLNTQYRMRPCIAELLVPSIYDTLLSSDSVKAYEDVRHMEQNFFFVQHSQPEKQSTDMSFENLYEAEQMAKLAVFLVEKSRYQLSDIVILTPYNAQVECIMKKLPKKYRTSVQVASVDSFQGLEANIVLLSLVRSNSSGQIGFLRQPNRVCVALSRARWGLYIIGNLEMLQQSGQKLWKTIANHLEENAAIGDAFPTASSV
ncbi:NFX1-type zinc finger-containing protein 1 [Drosophila kikkawai]|uniref:NFX1-type zinc finger-containing protein 1 n=1 Tax=Drosophila kikkawai TaxID=30033 RepID=A0ABM3C8N1_DROKI|nr:NFX1-type zinc finger-containing protein 1 [Drosophila kikkawai]